MLGSIELLKRQAEMAHEEMTTALEGVTQGQAWAVLPQGGPDYLHSDGSIHGIALHVATCKFIYGSAGFRDTEIRWRDLAERVESFEPNWAAGLEYLAEAHRYWIESWADLTAEDLETERPVFSGKLWPTWKILRTVTNHDSYHAGQIAVLRYAIGESDQPPPSVAEDIRKYCADLPTW